jgi:hypothetical protein
LDLLFPLEIHFLIEIDALVAPTTEMAAICVIQPQQKEPTEKRENERRHR